MRRIAAVSIVAVIVLLGFAPLAAAATRYVAVNGADASDCGSKTRPCRSITQGIALAAAGDKVIVGPGIYNAIFEAQVPGCDCMLAINKAVDLQSSHGAAQTIIDGRLSGQLTRSGSRRRADRSGNPGRASSSHRPRSIAGC